MKHIHEVIEDYSVLAWGYVFRDGYCFTAGSQSNVYDAIVVKNPAQCQIWSPKLGSSERSLEEHIQLINDHQLERAVIVAEDIGFLRDCPSLKHIVLHLGDDAQDKMDLSALYELPKLESISCRLQYGGPRELKSTVLDYSRMPQLREIALSGKGHRGYNSLKYLEKLSLSENKEHRDFTDFAECAQLKRIDLLQCGFRSLKGIKRFQKLQWLSLTYLRSLEDISELVCAKDSLRVLALEGCPKIKDFSCLKELHKLEHLQLMGSNDIPDLDFLKAMPNLKTFSFSVTVKSNDITPCLTVPYVWMKKGRKSYNLRPKDMPQRKTSGFELK